MQYAQEPLSLGGRQLSAHIDERMLSVLGGLLFIAFGMHAVWEVRSGVPLIILCRHAKLALLHLGVEGPVLVIVLQGVPA